MAKKSSPVSSSRMKRYEEKRLQKRLIVVSLGSVAIIALVFIFGFKVLLGISTLLDKTKGRDDSSTTNKFSAIIPPYLDPVPQATSSGKIVITGRGQKGDIVVLYVNDEETKKIRVADDGTFIISSITLPEGSYVIKAKAQTEQGKYSEFSNLLKTAIKRKPPTLEVSKPEDNATLSGADNLYTVEGKTDDDTDVRINDRFVVVHSDGTFSYPFPLQEGENTLKIRATDRAGNSTEISRKVTYKK